MFGGKYKKNYQRTQRANEERAMYRAPPLQYQNTAQVPQAGAGYYAPTPAYPVPLRAPAPMYYPYQQQYPAPQAQYPTTTTPYGGTPYPGQQQPFYIPQQPQQLQLQPYAPQPQMAIGTGAVVPYMRPDGSGYALGRRQTSTYSHSRDGHGSEYGDEGCCVEFCGGCCSPTQHKYGRRRRRRRDEEEYGCCDGCCESDGRCEGCCEGCAGCCRCCKCYGIV